MRGREQREYWLWLGATVLGLGIASTGIASALYAKRMHFAFWMSPEMLFAYVTVAVAVAFFVLAARGVPFPLAADRRGRFPDVEIHVNKTGFGTVVEDRHGMKIERSIGLLGVRVVNHEPERTAVLTFRVFQKWKPQADVGPGPEDTLMPPWTGAHPDGQPAVSRPVNVPPGAAVSGDVLYELGVWRDLVEPMRRGLRLRITCRV
jgi:hypothetical protein